MSKLLSENKDVMINNIKLLTAFLGSGAVALVATPIAALGVSVIASAAALASTVGVFALAHKADNKVFKTIRDNNIAEVKTFGTPDEQKFASKVEHDALQLEKNGASVVSTKRVVVGLAVVAGVGVLTNAGVGLLAAHGVLHLMRNKENAQKRKEGRVQETELSKLAQEIRARRTSGAPKTSTIKL